MKVIEVRREFPKVEFNPVIIEVKFTSLKEVAEIRKALGPLCVGFELYEALGTILEEEKQ